MAIRNLCSYTLNPCQTCQVPGAGRALRTLAADIGEGAVASKRECRPGHNMHKYSLRSR